MELKRYVCNICNHQMDMVHVYLDAEYHTVLSLKGPPGAAGSVLERVNDVEKGSVHICNRCWDGLTMLLCWGNNKPAEAKISAGKYSMSGMIAVQPGMTVDLVWKGGTVP